MKSVTLPDGTSLPALGLGTWHLGEVARHRQDEVAAVRLALELGYRLIDTAEMYAEGGAEQIVGQAVAAAIGAGVVRRDDLFIVSKVYPHNASLRGIADACARSLKRLALDRIDLYLLHWPGSHPLEQTVAGFEALQAQGRIGAWGVSNFDVDDMHRLKSVAGGSACAANQVYYSLSTRGAEVDLFPWLRSQAMPIMAYSPLDQGALANAPALADVARRLGVTRSQVALAWLIAQPGVIAIPKAVRASHLRENLAAAELRLTPAHCAEIESSFPPPRHKVPLAML